MMTTAQIVHMATLPPQAARAFMRECAMWPGDRERHLYITGRTAEAAVLDELADIEENGTAEAKDLRAEVKDLQDTIDRMENEARDMEDAVEAAEEKVLTLTAELENARDEVQQLREQIRAAGVDLV